MPFKFCHDQVSIHNISLQAGDRRLASQSLMIYLAFSIIISRLRKYQVDLVGGEGHFLVTNRILLQIEKHESKLKVLTRVPKSEIHIGD